MMIRAPGGTLSLMRKNLSYIRGKVVAIYGWKVQVQVAAWRDLMMR